MLLTGLLARFAELHPDAQIFARVAGTAELEDMLERSQLDVVIGYAAPGHAHAIRTATTHWLGEESLLEKDVLPLAVLEKPCRFREAAIAALDAERRPWRIAVETPNLTTLRAAVAAGLGVTCRTDIFMRDLPALNAGALPHLPDVSCILLSREAGGETIEHLVGLAVDSILMV